MKNFKGLKVWEKAHALTLATYRATARFPREEQFGLTAQIRRSSASIPANIAEGCGRDGDRELGRYLRIAMGPTSELEYHLLLARDLRLRQDTVYQSLTGEVTDIKRMLTGFLKKLTADS
ncbi:MAG: four helix bundle protein [Nitrospirota bacterium]|jgi:four helix bundle protein